MMDLGFRVVIGSTLIHLFQFVINLDHERGWPLHPTLMHRLLT